MKKLILTLTLITTTYSLTAESSYFSNHQISEEEAIAYNNSAESAARYIAYRDVPELLNKYTNGDQALDYGSGTGISTNFLLSQGFNAKGVDTSIDMVNEARKSYPDITFTEIEKGCVPEEGKSFDLIFSSLVLFEQGSEEEMVTYLSEGKRVMRDDGVMIAITGNSNMYNVKNWYTFDTDYPDNENLESGSLAKVYLKDAGIEFTDFYWTNEDYLNFFELSGLEVLEAHYPLGREGEPYPWQAEMELSPFTVFVAKKQRY